MRTRFSSSPVALAVLLAQAALLPPLAIAGDNELSEEERAAGWQLLFNGRDHDGWICNTGKPIATSIDDGCLVPFKSGGYIIYYDKKK
ncbi:MAG: hypothetical protein AB7U73_15530, partial [Pirellulales bacterium]